MKFAIICLSVLVKILVVGQALASKDDKFEIVRIPCMKRNNVTEEEYTVLALGKDLERMDQKFKCLGRCLANDMGYLDEMGKLNVKKLVKDVEMRETDVDNIKECRAKHDMEEEPCEYIYKLWVCVLRKIRKEFGTE